MIIRLEQDDRIVYRHEVPQYDERGSMFTFLVAPSNDGADEYVVVWKVAESEYHDEWHLGWKGDWDGCAKYYIGLTGDLEANYEQSRTKGEVFPHTDLEHDRRARIGEYVDDETGADLHNELVECVWKDMYEPFRDAVYSAVVGLPKGAVHVFVPSQVEGATNCNECGDLEVSASHVREDETLLEYIERCGGQGTRN